MSLSKNVKIALASSLLVTLVSCGGDNKSKSAPEMNTNTVVQSYNWKLMNGRGFPVAGTAYVEIDNVPVVNECNAKNINMIDRSSAPESVSFRGEAPTGEFSKVMIDDCTNMGVSPLTETVRVEVSKSGSVANVTLSI